MEIREYFIENGGSTERPGGVARLMNRSAPLENLAGLLRKRVSPLLSAPLMSKIQPSRPAKLTGQRRFGIVASLYNSEYVEGLVEAARKELKAVAPKAQVDLVYVPGSYEIPLGVKAYIDSAADVDAVLAFGLLWDGETMHAGLIATAVTNSLLDISLNYDTPVLHEVLVVKTAEQAKERCLGTKINRGTEAARAAVRMVQTMDSLPSNDIPF